MNDGILHVKMFGGFSLEYNGTAIGTGVKKRDSYFTLLMEAVLFHRKTGILRAHLENILFEDKDLLDVHHTMRTVLYNAKQVLRKGGLPEGEYFAMRDGRMVWLPDIPVDIDTERFEKLYEDAENEDDPEVRKRLYQEAAFSYTGEFLPQQTRLIWVAQEDRRFRDIFCSCVNSAAALMRMDRDFSQLETLGRYASRIQPLSEWEPVIMEGLVGMGRQAEARDLYEKTVDAYMEALGFRPSFASMNLLEKLGGQITHSHALLDEIQLQLTGAGAPLNGGYVTSYPIFAGIYQLIERMTERGGQSVYLMLCTIVNAKGAPMEEGTTLERLSGRLGDSILHSVRHSDTICRYGIGQYLVLLINTTRENCSVVQSRINYHFLQETKRAGVQYFVNSVIYSADDPEFTKIVEQSAGKGGE